MDLRPQFISVLVIAMACLGIVRSEAAAPTQMNYQGQLRSNGALFTGTAQMKFAIVDGATWLWSNDSTGSATTPPTNPVSVPVSNGLFTAMLGAAPMKPLGPGVFATVTSPMLRVWVSTGGAFEQLSDQPVGSAPYSFQAGGADSLWTSGGLDIYHLGGNVGIGTPSPAARLHVAGGDVAVEAGRRVVLNQGAGGNNYLWSPSTPNPRLAVFAGNQERLSVDYASGDIAIGAGQRLVLNQGAGGNNYLWSPSTPNPPLSFFTGNQVRLSIDYLTGNASLPAQLGVNVLQINGGSDLAEPFEVANAPAGTDLKPGMVVTIDPDHTGRLRLASQPYDPTVAGILSGAKGLSPGLVMKSSGKPEADGTHPVALSGRVWCWVDASFGAVHPGDLLTTSSTEGMAMVATDSVRRQGAILGKAMSALERGRGLVLVLVSLQ